jgi:hypothetical protein
LYFVLDKIPDDAEEAFESDGEFEHEWGDKADRGSFLKFPETMFSRLDSESNFSSRPSLLTVLVRSRDCDSLKSGSRPKTAQDPISSCATQHALNSSSTLLCSQCNRKKFGLEEFKDGTNKEVLLERRANEPRVKKKVRKKLVPWQGFDGNYPAW